MEVNDFKEGEECLVRVRVSDEDGASVGFDTIGERGECLMESSFRLLETELDAVVKEDKPKYDPFRKFKYGDEVRVVPRDRRAPVCFPANRVRVGDLVTVCKDEDDSGFVEVCSDSGHKMSVAFFFLVLVTPAEVRRPYSIELGVTGKGTDYRIWKDGVIICAYSCAHPNAKAAAEAERKRLNDEWQAKACRSDEGKEVL